MNIYQLTTECRTAHEHTTPFVLIFTTAEQAITSALTDRDEWLSEVSYGVDEYRICVECLSPESGQFYVSEKLYDFLWKTHWLRSDPRNLSEDAVVTESYG